MARSRQRTEAATGTPPPAAAGLMAFIGGIMHINGIAQHIIRTVQRVSSNGTTRYTAIEWADPGDDSRRTSCNCPGWANRRSCKHVKELEDNPGIGLLNDADVVLPGIAQRPRIVEHRTEDGRALRGLSFD